MARPTKQTVDYFPHSCDSSKTIPILESKYGNDGYAFWFKLLELLAKTDGHYYDCNNPSLWGYLLAKTRVNEDTGNSILADLANLGKIDKDLWEFRVIWCQNLVNNVADVYKRRQTETPLKPSYDQQEQRVFIVPVDINPTSPRVSGSTNRQSKVKYSKVEYIIYILWNEQGIIKHNNLTEDTTRAISRALKDYTQEEICQAIKNYSEILKDEQYYFKYSWTLKDFLKRGLAKFLDINIARKNYLKDNGDGRTRTRQQSPPGKTPQHYTIPDDLRHN